MKRFMTIAIVLCAITAGLLVTQTSRSATDDAALQADRALQTAYAKGDSAAVKKLLDEEFRWIDTDGIMYERADSLRANLKPLVPMTADTKISTSTAKWSGFSTTSSTNLPPTFGCSVRRAGACCM